MINNNKHANFMKLALEAAKKALTLGEVPIGAVIVDSQGKVVSKAYNQVEKAQCQTAHAEVLSIGKACKKLKNWRLEGASLYVTLEPCLMCFGLIALSRIKNLYFGATSPLFGCGLDKEESFPIYRRGLQVQGGLMAKESSKLLVAFFKEVRVKKGSI